MKITKIENNIINFINQNLNIIFVAIMTLLALVIRYVLIPFESSDYVNFLAKWMDEIDSYGGLTSLKYAIGDYNVPYMVILSIISYLPFSHLFSIKVVSIIFDIVLAITASLIVGEILKKNKNVRICQMIVYLIVLFLPTVVINSSYWGQCDSIYSSFVLLSVYFLLKDKITPSFILLGVAFAFKLQTVFLLPVYLIIYLSKHSFSLFNFLIIPLVNVIMCLPAIFMGRSFVDVMSIYLHQTSIYKSLTLGVPNLYHFINGSYELISKFAIILTLVVFGFLLYFILKNKVKFDNEKILTLCLISILICNFFLPAMHERYLFMADVFSVVWYISYRKKIYIPIGICFMSIIAYMNFLYVGIGDYEWKILTVLYGFILFDLIKYFVNICLKTKMKGDVI